MSAVGRHFPVLINKGYAGFREMTAPNELVVDVAGTSHGRTVLLFAGGRQWLAQHPGGAGLQAVTAGDEEVQVLEIARFPALGTFSCRIPENYFRYMLHYTTGYYELVRCKDKALLASGELSHNSPTNCMIL